jgi:hypothetical protein
MTMGANIMLCLQKAEIGFINEIFCKKVQNTAFYRKIAYHYSVVKTK